MKRADLKSIFGAIKEIGLNNLISGYWSVNNKKSFGSTNPTLVRQATKRDERWLKTAYAKLVRGEE